MALPEAQRINFRQMTDRDLPLLAALLGDPAVMTFYPRPKTELEAQAWIDGNRANYARDGYGLWIIETPPGEFLGDCGLTWQAVNGRMELELGYHVHAAAQGVGYATEAAKACRDFARDVLHQDHLVAIIHHQNVASRRVAEKVGMTLEEEDLAHSAGRHDVFGMTLSDLG